MIVKSREGPTGSWIMLAVLLDRAALGTARCIIFLSRFYWVVASVRPGETYYDGADVLF